MADNTPNIDLEKPLGSENFRRKVFNDNMDRIDKKFGIGTDEGHIHNGTSGQGKKISFNNLIDRPESFIPSKHKSTHGAGGSDSLTPADIGALSNGANAVSDTNIGNRTADSSQVPNGLIGSITQWFSWITNRIKAITGKNNWWENPSKSLEQLNNEKLNKSGDTMNGNLTVNGYGNFTYLGVGGNKLFELINYNPEMGPINPIWYALRTGKKLFSDEEFATGLNNVCVYNNTGGSCVAINRVSLLGVPNSTGYALEIRHNGIISSPGFGGFYQAYLTKANGVFVQLFKAKVPVGYTLNTASNQMGTNAHEYWLTNNVGTGRWEYYIRVVVCGNTGEFSTGGFVFLLGSPEPTSSSNIVWYLASCTAYDMNYLS